MTSKNLFGINAFFVLVLIIVAAATAQLAAAQESDAPAITWSASSAGEGLPEQTAPGYIVFEVNGDNDTGYEVSVFRLKEGATLEAFKEVTAAIDRAVTGEGNVVEAINAGLEVSEVIGGIQAEAGASARFGAVLEEGSYVLQGTPGDDSPDSQGMPERTFKTLTVSGTPQAEAPEADQTVQMVDFAFALPTDIQAGEQLWQVSNVGQQLHHMVLFQLAEGKTMEDFQTWMLAEGQGEPAADFAGGVSIMSPGRSVYVPMNLEPGAYVAMCFMEDHRGNATGQPHFMLGMMQAFTVAGEQD